MAQLRGVKDHRAEDLYALLDCQIVMMSETGFTLAGIERTDDQVDFAQSWYVMRWMSVT